MMHTAVHSSSTAPEQCVMTTNISLDGVIETEPRSSSLQNYNLAASDLKVKTPDEQHKHTLMNAAPSMRFSPGWPTHKLLQLMN